MDNQEDFDQTYPHWEEALAGGSFEEVLAALEGAVSCLESGRLTLERSLRCFEVGARLAERADQMLADAELRVSRLDGVLNHLGDADDLFTDDDDDFDASSTRIGNDSIT